MAANKKRVNQFNSDIRDLEAKLGFEEFYKIFRAKILDLMQRAEIGGETLTAFKRQINKVISPEFAGFTDRVTSAYGDALALVNSHYHDVGPDVTRNLSKIVRLEKVNQTRLGNYKEGTVREISKILRSGILEGKNSDAIAKDIDIIGGRVSSFANTIARTQLKGYGQTGVVEKARIGEVFFFEYIGIIRADTRKFCMELLNQTDPTFHIQDIRQMRNAQIGNPENYSGGFNCHHYWEPDPFFDGENYAVSFYTTDVGNRTIKLARQI